jgi:3-keto-5-aminohexanoate cleavage enzyme
MKLDKLIINAALTGMVPTPRDNPHVPVTVEEIVRDARRCAEAGASIVHIHARDPEGRPTHRREILAEIFAGIRAACPGVMISGTTSGRVDRQFDQRAQVLELENELKPDLASLTLGSMNLPNQASVNEPQMIQDLATAMRNRGIVPELELFDLGMADYARYLIDRGVLRPPFYANLLLGSLGTLAATPYNLATLVRALPSGTTWAAAGIGRFQLYVNSMAITMGGHVRVGLEDNLWFDADRREPATNARLVERLVKLATLVGREIATPDEARAMIGISARRTAVAPAPPA